MNTTKKAHTRMFAQTIALMFALAVHGAAMAGEAHDHGEEHAHEEAAALTLSPEQIATAGIRSEPVRKAPLPIVIEAPGIVQRNAWRMADITARAAGIIHARHARLGEQVRHGQRLVTLQSPALAMAQADYLKARADFERARQARERLRKLAARQIASRARLQQAESDWQAARAAFTAAKAALMAKGMRKQDIAGLDKARAFGLLTLSAPIAGVVTRDDFRLGQHVGEGALLMQIADESTVWVEARVSAGELSRIHPGQRASIWPNSPSNGAEATATPAIAGKVIALHHGTDAATRTAIVRIEANNRDDRLHPGMFVRTHIQIGSRPGSQRGNDAVLLAPGAAIQRQGGERIVFVETAPGRFERREVRTGRKAAGMVEIVEGLREGERIVVRGAFMLASELAKSGFEAHNH